MNKRPNRYDMEIEQKKFEFERLLKRYKNMKGAQLELKIHGLDHTLYYQHVIERKNELYKMVVQESKEIFNLVPTFKQRKDIPS